MSKKKPKLNLKKLSLEREPLNHANEQREACKLCGLCKWKENPALPGVPEDWSGSLLVVSEGNEDGRTKKLTRAIWRKAGWRDSDVAIVPAVRGAARNSPSMVSIRACRPFLLQVIAKLKPRNIVALGATGMRALRNAGETNITKNRGKEIRIPGL
jgi:uracil-DNA glycosylase family 4